MPTSPRVTYHLEVDPYDPVAGTTVAVRATTAKEWNTSSLDTPASTTYEPGLQIEGYGSSILDENGHLGGVVESKLGTMVIPNSHAGWDSLLRCTWNGRTATLYRVEPNAAHSSRTIELRGYVSGVTFGQTEVRIALESFNAKLAQKDVQSAKFWGRPRCLRFGDASAHRVTVADTGNKVDMTGSWTVEFLFRSQGTPAALRYIWHKVSAGSGYYVGRNASDQIVVSNDGTEQTFSVGTTTAGIWYWVSCVWDTAANQTRIYFNGDLDQQASKTNDPVGTAVSAYMGGDSGTNSCHGDIAEMRVWSVARTQEEILRTMYGGVARNDTGLVWWFKGNPGSGATANDESYSALNGSITGASWFGTHEGDEQLGGTYKPWSLGQAYYAEPQLIDAQKLIWMVNSRGFDTASVPLLWDGGAAVPLDSTTPTTTDLYNATVGAGKFSYSPGHGAFRTGSAPSTKFAMTFRAAAYSTLDTRLPVGSLKALVVESAGFSGSDYSVADTDFRGFYGQTGEVLFIDVATANASTDTTGAISVTIPATAQVGDLLLLFLGTHHDTIAAVYQDWTAATPTKTGGSGSWTAVIDGVANSGVVSAHRCYCWRTVMTSGETAVSVATNIGNAPNRNATLLVLRGQNTTTPIVTSAETSPDTADSSAPAPDVTTTSDGDLLVCAWATANGADYNQPAGMTQDANLSQTGGTNGNRSTLKVAHEQRSTAGATGTRSITVSASRHVGVSVVVGIQLSSTPVLAAHHGIYFKEGGVKVREAVGQILTSYRAWGGFGYDGIFRAKDMTKSRVPSATTEDLTEDDVEGLVVVGILPLIKEVRGEWRPYWPPYSAAEINGSVGMATAWDLQQPFRSRRFPRVRDRSNRALSNYNEDAQEMELRTLLIEEWAAAVAAQQVLDFRDSMVPVWRCTILDREKFPSVGDTVSITHSRLGCSSPVKCIVASNALTIRAGRPVMTVDLVDAATIAVYEGGAE